MKFLDSESASNSDNNQIIDANSLFGSNVDATIVDMHSVIFFTLQRVKKMKTTLETSEEDENYTRNE